MNGTLRPPHSEYTALDVATLLYLSKTRAVWAWEIMKSWNLTRESHVSAGNSVRQGSSPPASTFCTDAASCTALGGTVAVSERPYPVHTPSKLSIYP